MMTLSQLTELLGWASAINIAYLLLTVIDNSFQAIKHFIYVTIPVISHK